MLVVGFGAVVQGQLGVGATEEVVFIQTSAEEWRHRDGLRFTNGQEILLQRLAETQRADILSLSLGALSEEGADAVAVTRVALGSARGIHPCVFGV